MPVVGCDSQWPRCMFRVQSAAVNGSQAVQRLPRGVLGGKRDALLSHEAYRMSATWKTWLGGESAAAVALH